MKVLKDSQTRYLLWVMKTYERTRPVGVEGEWHGLMSVCRLIINEGEYNSIHADYFNRNLPKFVNNSNE